MGVFTLFGSKPITELLMPLDDAPSLSLDEIPEELRSRCVFKEDHTRENMEAWKKFSKKLQIPRFRLVEVALPNNEWQTIFLFVNVEQTKQVLENIKTNLKKSLSLIFPPKKPSKN